MRRKNITLWLLIFMIPLLYGSIIHVASFQEHDTLADLNQTGTSTINEPLKELLPVFDPEIKANVTDNQRSITILQSAKVILEDVMKIRLVGNSKPIKYLNYSLPSFMGNNYVKATFWFSFNQTLPERNSTYSRPFEVFYGVNYTNFKIAINPPDLIGGVYLNNQTTMYVETKIEFQNLMTFYLDGTVQKGEFNTSILPLLPNVEIGNSSAISYIKAADTIDIDAIRKGRENAESWIIKHLPQSVVFANLTRTPFDISKPLLVNDTNRIVIQSPATAGGNDASTIPYVFTNIQRDVFISTWGRIFIREHITVKHLGATRPSNTSEFVPYSYALTKVQLSIPKNGTPLTVYDDLGILNVGNRESDTGYLKYQETLFPGYKTVDVTLRLPIYGGENASFTFEYTLNSEAYLYEDGDHFSLRLPLMDLHNSTVESFTMNLHLPVGSAFTSTNATVQTKNARLALGFDVARYASSLSRHRVVIIKGWNLTDADNLVFTFNYDFNRIYYLAGIMNYFLYTLILLSGYYLFRTMEINPEKKQEREEYTKEVIPIEEIHKFLEDYAEKDGIRRRIRSLYDNYRSRKIKAKEYNSQLAKLESRMRVVIKRLHQSSRQLQHQGPKYATIVEKILVSDQKLNDTIDNQQKLELNYRKGIVTKDTYLHTMRTYESDLQKVQSEINTRLNELKQLLERN